MSKWAAIDTAVRLQLALDGKTIDYRKQYGDHGDDDDWVNLPPAVIPKFLMDVANRLRFDKPPLVFSWRRVDAAKIAGQRLAMIVAIIEDETEEPSSS
ncbi:MAG TPA: hypothetical protein VE650_08435 [Acetobacteraceae bacterium]|nr:hypothetical protein [Acetobacteraceae bacterium]